MMTSVRAVLDRNKGIGPGFHLLRHVLAILIVAWHCRQAIWWSDSAQALASTGKLALGLPRAGEWNAEDIIRPVVHSLIGMFFALSGFLVMGSAIRTRSTSRFLMNRALRIFPALGAETLLSAFLLGPIATTLTLQAYFTHPEFFTYFGNIVGWLHYTLPGVFEDNPYPKVINGQLWTLQPEFWCYLTMAALMSLGVVYKRVAVGALVGVAFVTAAFLFAYDPLTFSPKGENFFYPWYITLLFWLGVTCYHYADKIPVNFALFIASGALYWSIMFFNVAAPLAGIPLTYMMLYIGMTAFPWWDRLVKSDYSYGIYLYHFPIIQAVMWLVTPTAFGRLPNAIKFVAVLPLSLVVSIGFAALSWRYIEKPALGLRKAFAKTKSATGAIPPDSIREHGFAVAPDAHEAGENKAPAT